MVHLSDLHNSEFGEGNSRLLDMTRQQNPDLILITGDQLNLDEEDTSVAVDTVAALCETAPVYFFTWQSRSGVRKELRNRCEGIIRERLVRLCWSVNM